jgi:L-fucose isomerase-like protein
MKKQMTMGLLIGNRGFFPDHLARSGREAMIRALQGAGINAVVLGPDETKHGAVETRDDARKCAALFDANRDRIGGVIVALPNFGDERAVAETLRMARLDVPVLIQAFPDKIDAMSLKDRGDSFCGKMSVCNNLTQYGIPYSLTSLHTEAPDSEQFKTDLDWFAGVCRVAGGLKGLRVGAIGTRPPAFNTVRFSEKILEAHGITVEPVDLSEILGRIHRLKDNDDSVTRKLEEIRSYIPASGVPEEALLRMARLAAVIDAWMREVDVAMTTIQCWTAIEEYYGVVPCAVMSMMSDSMMPSACELDVCGMIAMYALQLASETPSALLDWNNNYGSDPNKAVCFHCSNLPKHFFEDVRMDFQEIIAGTVGRQNAYGTCVGRIKAGPMTYLRLSTNDAKGEIAGYLGEGKFTTDALETFGGYSVAEIPNLQKLLHHICERGFEHHVAASLSSVADAVCEAGGRYLGWNLYHHPWGGMPLR